MNLKNIFYFGEKVKGYNVRVLNEREIRAGSGILFLFALISFLTIILTRNFFLTKVFISVFLIDFLIRVFINPKFSPILILGKIVTRGQIPEYVGAPQKKFAWVLALIMVGYIFLAINIFQVMNPVNMLVCVSCILLLFLETSFGICVGCKIYNLVNKEKAELCPGQSCEIKKVESIQKTNYLQIIIVIIFLILSFFVIPLSFSEENNIEKDAKSIEKKKEIIENCEIPDFIKFIGHEEMYIENECMKK